MTPMPSMNPDRSDAILRMLTATAADDADARAAATRRKRTRGILIISMATAAVAVVTGVGLSVAAGSRQTAPGPGGGVAVRTSQPAAPVSPSATPTSTWPAGVDPAGTSSPVPTPTPTANTPSDASTWKITTDGIGPMKPGITLSAADEAARAAGLTQTDCGAGIGRARTHFYALPDGTRLIADPDADQGTLTVAIAGSIMGASTSGTVATPHGIHIGSTVDELRATYPNLVLPQNGMYPSESGYALSDGAGHWIDFVVDNALHTVQEIVVTIDNVVPSEFCG